VKRPSIALNHTLTPFPVQQDKSIHYNMTWKQSFYTPEEVAVHNNADDCWVTIYDQVFDLTELISQHRGLLADPIVKCAGTSISHWFRQDTGDVKTYVDPERNITVPYTPQGRFIHVPPLEPSDNYLIVDTPWWLDPKYVIGKLTQKKRLIRIANMLTRTEETIHACQEETIKDIRERYLEYNKHASSYTWKALLKNEFVTLDMELTLEQNGVEDESDKFAELGVDEDHFVPTLHIYFNDDLTYA